MTIRSFLHLPALRGPRGRSLAGATTPCRHQLDPLEPRMLMSSDGLLDGLHFLAEQQDQYRRAAVYTEVDGASLWLPTKVMNAAVGSWQIDTAWTEGVLAGQTAMRIHWDGTTFEAGQSWMAVVFEWPIRAVDGRDPDPSGWDVRGATRLSFAVRAEIPGENVRFGIGLGSVDGFELREGPITIGDQWQVEHIDVPAHLQDEAHLGQLNAGFVVLFDSDPRLDRNGRGATIYLDDVQYDVPVSPVLQLMDSHRAIIHRTPRDDTVYRSVCFTYDNAQAALAFMAAGDWPRAGSLLETFDWITRNDRLFGSWEDAWRPYVGPGLAWARAAYAPGPVRDPAPLDGGAPRPRLAFYNDDTGWHDFGRVILTGDNAWLMLALLAYHNHHYPQTGDARYLQDAVSIGTFVEQFHDTAAPVGLRGYMLGLHQDVLDPASRVKSVEHNLDVAAAFWTIADALELVDAGQREALGAVAPSVWRTRAEDAAEFVMSMYSEGRGRFHAGVGPDGVTPNTTAAVLDVQTWAPLLLARREGYRDRIDWRRPLAWVKQQLLTRAQIAPGIEVTGADFGFENHSGDLRPDGVWVEGTAHLALAYLAIGDPQQHAYFLRQLELLQAHHPDGDGRGLVSAGEDGVRTVFGNNVHDARLAVAPTAWGVMAALGYNPFRGTTIEQVPVEVVETMVNGSRWSSVFRDGVDRVNGLGVPIPRAGDMIRQTIPWSGIDSVTIRFGGPVDLAGLDLAIYGVEVTEYELDTAGPRYDPTTFAATWRLSAPTRIDTDRLLIHLSNGGAIAEVEVSVALGDVDGNGRTDGEDIRDLRALLGATVGACPYHDRADLNGDGAISIRDIASLRRGLGAHLPAADPEPLKIRERLSLGALLAGRATGRTARRAAGSPLAESILDRMLPVLRRRRATPGHVRPERMQEQGPRAAGCPPLFRARRPLEIR